jgi:tRNA nucleotidyltransferase (CCA-adding enzyme)
LELLDRVLGSRLFTELKYILSENSYLKGINKLNEYNMLKFFSKKIRITETKLKRFQNLDKIYHWFNVQCEEKIDIWIPRFCILFNELKFRDMIKLADRLDFTPDFRKEFTKNFFHTRRVVFRVLRNKDITNYFIYESFNYIPNEFILLASAILGEKYEYIIKNYFTKIKKIKLEISGKDLIKLGFKPSIQFGEVLNKLLKMKINGEISTKEEELKHALLLMEKENK